jgi:hypothetical protein
MAGPTLAVIVVTMAFIGILIPWCVATVDAAQVTPQSWTANIAVYLVFLMTLSAALALGSSIGLEIRMVEQISWRWSWQGPVLGAVIGVAICCFFKFIEEAMETLVSLLVALGFMERQSDSTNTLQFIGVVFIGAALGGTWGGLRKSERLTKRQWPGAGLTRTLQNAAIVILGFSFTGMLLCSVGVLALKALIPSATWVVSSQSFTETAVQSAAIGASIGLVFGLFLGGSDALIKHWLLRLQLRASGCIPLRLVGFLEHARSYLLLRRVGAGYIFLHRYLLEHFADRCPADLAHKGASAGEAAGRTMS